MKKLLQLRKELKSKKPKFIRQQSQRKKLKKVWRRAKGIHSKMRLRHKGHRKTPSIGYSSPKKVKGLNQSGLKEVLIHNLKELACIKKNEGVVISSRVGVKNKLNILKKCKELKLSVLNIKNIDNFIKDVEEKFKKKKGVKKKKEEKPKEVKKPEEKKETPKNKEETEKKEKIEKLAKRKVLEKRI